MAAADCKYTHKSTNLPESCLSEARLHGKLVYLKEIKMTHVNCKCFSANPIRKSTTTFLIEFIQDFHNVQSLG